MGKQQAPVSWIEWAPGLPNAKEVLLYSLRTVLARGKVADLNKWVGEVRRYLQARWESEGLAGLPDEWKPSPKVNSPLIYERLRSACEGELTGADADKLAHAMSHFSGHDARQPLLMLSV